MYLRKFVGRQIEMKALRSWLERGQSALTAVYGRRRIGKTRLIEEAYGDKLFKFEGLENQSAATQRLHFRDTLADYTNDINYRHLESKSWKTLLVALSRLIGKRQAIVLFDEFQWLAAERTELVSTLKFVWDNYFSKHNNVHIIVCGSISSFIVKKVIKSKALYGRIDLKIYLKPLRLSEIKGGFFPKIPDEEIVQYWMALGGVPKYLEMCSLEKSFEQNMIHLFFSPLSPLQDELENLFVSHFGKRPEYQKAIQFLANKRYASRKQIANKLGISSGGGLSKILEELQFAGFVEECFFLQEFGRPRTIAYRISDPFLRFYFKFVRFQTKKLANAHAPLSVQLALPSQQYKVWRGLAFELSCYHHAQEIAQELGFSAVDYQVGMVFSQPDIPQVDLAFSRSDNVMIICEIKYKERVGKEIIAKSKKQLAQLQHRIRSRRNKQMHAVLISATKPEPIVFESHYYTRILGLDALTVPLK